MEITIANTVYEIKDVLCNITIADSAVKSKHKIGKGNGERKIYLSGNVEERISFFDNFESEIRGFVWTQNLIEYLIKSKSEYKNPTYEYKDRKNMPKEYDRLMEMLSKKNDILMFKVKKSDVTHAGIYINQDSGKKTDPNWNLIGNIALPRVSRLSILKLSREGKISYYFKVTFGAAEEENSEEEIKTILEKLEKSKLKPAEKEAVIQARVGQGTYRRKLLEETSVCPFTMVDDEHLLIASHIKPWKKSPNREKKDPKNGFVFTPTYDKLFDRGYISFTDDKRLIVSPWLSRYNCERLGLDEGKIIEKLPVIDEKRRIYLAYHRTHVLKKLEDL